MLVHIHLQFLVGKYFNLAYINLVYIIIIFYLVSKWVGHNGQVCLCNTSMHFAKRPLCFLFLSLVSPLRYSLSNLLSIGVFALLSATVTAALQLSVVSFFSYQFPCMHVMSLSLLGYTCLMLCLVADLGIQHYDLKLTHRSVTAGHNMNGL